MHLPENQLLNWYIKKILVSMTVIPGERSHIITGLNPFAADAKMKRKIATEVNRLLKY